MGQMMDTCCGKSCDTIECILETFPYVTIVAFLFSIVGLVYNTRCIDDTASGLEAYGLDAGKYSDEMVYTTYIMFAVNGLILFFALFSTGWCREKIFRESKSTTGFCAQVIFGPLVQSVFFMFVVAGMVLSFICSTLSIIAYVIALLGEASCSQQISYVYTPTSSDWGNCTPPSLAVARPISLETQSIFGDIVRRADYPDMFASGDNGISVVNGSSSLCNNNGTFKTASYECTVGFIFMLVAQTLFLTKIIHTFICLRYDMTKLSDSDDNDSNSASKSDDNDDTPIKIELSAHDLYQTNSLRVRDSHGQMINVNISAPDVISTAASGSRKRMSESEKHLIREHRRSKRASSAASSSSSQDVIDKLRTDNMKVKRELVQLRMEASKTDALRFQLQKTKNELVSLQERAGREETKAHAIAIASRGAEFDTPLDSEGVPIPPPPAAPADDD